MRAHLRRRVVVVATAVAIALVTAAAPHIADVNVAEEVCQAGTNWDNVLKVCR
jgi:hypothetical protein